MDAGTVLTVSLAAVRDDLAIALEETLKLARQLAEDARDPEVAVAERLMNPDFDVVRTNVRLADPGAKPEWRSMPFFRGLKALNVAV